MTSNEIYEEMVSHWTLFVENHERFTDKQVKAAGVRARKSINELTKTIEDEITEQEKEYKKRQQELLELQKTLNQEKFDSLVLKFNKNVSKIQKNIQQKKIALEQAHSQAIEVVHQKTISIIGNLAKKYSLDIVLPTSQVLYVKSELNITPEVISKLNNDLKEVPINYQKFLKN